MTLFSTVTTTLSTSQVLLAMIFFYSICILVRVLSNSISWIVLEKTSFSFDSSFSFSVRVFLCTKWQLFLWAVASSLIAPFLISNHNRLSHDVTYFMSTNAITITATSRHLYRRLHDVIKYLLWIETRKHTIGQKSRCIGCLMTS